MPKKLNIPKSQNICVFHTSIFDFCVIRFNKPNGELSYFQVRKNRRKIANYQDHQVAIRRMLAEVNYEFADLFNQNYLQL